MKIILLPGLDGTGTLYKDFTTALHDEHECIALKYPTDKLLDYSELEILIRSQLPAHEPFILLAESFSGPLGVMIAANQPLNLIGLILCCTFVRQPVSSLLPAKTLIRIIPLEIIPKWLMSKIIIGKFNTRKTNELLRKALEELPSNIIKNRMLSALEINVLNELTQVKIPTIYLHATQDNVIRKKSAKEIQSVLSSTDIISINAPHFLLQTKPKEAADIVRAFIENIKYKFD